MKTQTRSFSTINSIGSAFLVAGAMLAGTTKADTITADFNGDGRQDLITGQPYEDFTNLPNAGAVKVVYGRSKGGMDELSTTAYLHQTKSGIGGIHLVGYAQVSDMFGDRISVGDFNADGYDDVAIGVKAEDIGSLNNAGQVHIVYGSSAGLRAANNHILDLGKVRSGKYRHAQNQFGVDLATGDYDGDGIDDLAVGFLSVSPIGENDSTAHGGGAVIFYGTETNGLKNADTSPYTRTLARYWNPANQNDYYGGRLTSGDFNGDNIDDLAVSAYKEDLMVGDIGRADAGTVRIHYGFADWTNTFGLSPKIVPIRKDVYGNFGFALESADLDNNGRDELLIGAPGSGIGGSAKSGAMVIARVQPNGSITQTWYYQSQSLFPGVSSKDDRFGHAITVADFNGDQNDDVAIAVPYKDKTGFFHFSNIRNPGEVLTIYGNGWGGFNQSQVWHQDRPGVDGYRADNDYFGYTLGSGDFNADNKADLMVGVPFEDIGTKYNVGVIQIIRGSDTGLNAAAPGEQIFDQLSFTGWGFGSGIATTENESYDYFGWALP